MKIGVKIGIVKGDTREKLDNRSNIKSKGHINLVSPINSNIIAYAVTANSSKITQGYS